MKRAEWTVVSIRTMALFAVLAAVLGFLTNGYRYGLVDHIDHLPLVERAMDADYLPRDPYLNGQEGFNVRYFYTRMMAGLGRAVTLPGAYFGGLLLCTIAVALVTAFAARELSGGSSLAGMLAAAAAVVVQCFHLGNTAAVFSSLLLPESPALPFALAGLWMGVRGRAVLAAVLSSIASLFHPLIGLECGAISIFIAFVQLFSNVQMISKARSTAKWLAGAAILLLFAGFWSVAPRFSETAGRVPNAEFLGTLAWLRNPFHYIPSSWPLSNYLRTGLFVAAVALAWNRLRIDRRLERNPAWPLGAAIGAVLVLWVGGWLFVEVWPSRIWAVAQVFRLGLIVGWIGLIMIAGVAARLFERGEWEKGLLTAIGLATAAGAFVSQAGLAVLERGGRRFAPRRADWTVIGLTALAVFAHPNRIWAIVSLSAAGAGLTLIARTRRPAFCLIPPLAGIVLTAGLFVVNHIIASPVLRTALNGIQPVLTLDDIQEEYVPLARIARDRTPPDALMLVPPLWSGFRLHARRALVVDWTCFPFQDIPMREWRQRLEDCYGPLANIPDADITKARMNDYYRLMDDGKLRRLREKYGIDYAMLFDDTAISYPVLAREDGYKLVELK